MTDALFEARSLSLRFSGVRALDGVSLSVPDASIVAVIGPNGAGKTSLFNCISGVYRPDAGSIHLRGRDVTGHPAHEIAAMGIARTFQNLALFNELSVLDNLLVGRHHVFGTTWWQDLFWTPAARRAEVEHRRHVEEVIDFLDLEAYRRATVGALPYGVRKRVELGRALAMEPSILLLDEPAAGLTREERETLARHVLDVREERGVTQVLIEHEMRFVLDLADRIAVLDFGRKIAEGSPDEIARNPHVREAYVGAIGAGASP